MSFALDEFRAGSAEIGHLLQILPRRVRGISTNSDADRVIVRACIVLLTSHLERYLKAVNEEAISFVNGLNVTGDQVPRQIRLRHCADLIDDLASVQWDKREERLIRFSKCESGLWINGLVRLDARSLMAGFKTPKPETIRRYFEHWGVSDVFSSITRNSARRSHYWLSIQSLADKRNNIAHGHASETSTPSDVREFRDAVETVVDRLDRKLSSLIAKTFCCPRPW